MKIILAAHGTLASSMKQSIEMIFGLADKFYPVEFHKGEGTDDLLEKYKEILGDSQEDTLIIADLLCGSPYNAASMLAMEYEQVEVVSGMSLPMCLEVAVMYESSNSKDLIRHIKNSVQNYTKSFREELVLESEDDF